VTVISFHKSSDEASEPMLAVTTRRFTPAASAASRIRVVPDTAVYDGVSEVREGQDPRHGDDEHRE